MHFVTGGAFNGKSEWVKEHYQLKRGPHLWVSAYQGNPLPENLSNGNGSHLIIFEGIEIWLREWSLQLDISQMRERWRSLLRTWIEWEKENGTIILIGADITKGIVPMLAEERRWRDITGWAYQDASAAAERIDLIWYGISKKLK